MNRVQLSVQTVYKCGRAFDTPLLHLMSGHPADETIAAESNIERRCELDESQPGSVTCVG